MQAFLSILNMFSGPIGGLVDKAILAGVTYLFAAGKISGDVTGITASIYAALSAIFTALVTTQSAKIQSVNDTNNGVVVIPAKSAAKAGITPVGSTQYEIGG